MLLGHGSVPIANAQWQDEVLVRGMCDTDVSRNGTAWRMSQLPRKTAESQLLNAGR